VAGLVRGEGVPFTTDMLGTQIRRLAVALAVIGVLMAWFLGWLLGKAMVETQGFFWPWCITGSRTC
jgi:hypothetical protein